MSITARLTEAAKKTLARVEVAAPPLGRALRRWRQRRCLSREIRGGRYDPRPRRHFHFPDYDRATPERMIPRVWHVTWRSQTLPPDFRANWGVIQSLHPKPRWDHRIWTDADISVLVDRHFPRRREAFDALPRQIMRVDIFRYMLMAIHGGVYSDLDVRMFKPLDPLLDDCTLLLAAESDRVGDENFIAQHFMASAAGHPFWESLIAAALDRPLDEIRAYADPLTTTGPAFVTRVWRGHAQHHGAKVLMRVIMCPPSILGHPGLPVSPQSFGLHDCTGTWR